MLHAVSFLWNVSQQARVARVASQGLFQNAAHNRWNRLTHQLSYNSSPVGMLPILLSRAQTRPFARRRGHQRYTKK